jgi:hypothetical protein
MASKAFYHTPIADKPRQHQKNSQRIETTQRMKNLKPNSFLIKDSELIILTLIILTSINLLDFSYKKISIEELHFFISWVVSIRWRL